MRKDIMKPVELPYGKPLAIFATILTVAIMILLLVGILPITLTFVVGYAVLMVLTYKNPKNMGGYLGRQAPMILSLTMTMLGVAILVGVNNGTGALAEAAELIASSGGGFVKHLPWICCALSLPLSFVTGNAKMSVVIPAVAAVAAPFGIAPRLSRRHPLLRSHRG